MQVGMLHKKSLKKLSGVGYYDEFRPLRTWAAGQKFVQNDEKIPPQ
jgi:hypothetical protein